MRGLLKNIILIILTVFFVKTSLADDLFYQFNRDLERVGNAEFAKAFSTPFKGEIYRLEPDFKLGVGDTLVINLWGKIEEKYTLVIDNDGKILIPRIGSVYVVGSVLEEVKEKIKNALNQKYVNVQFDLSLGNVQDIRISVLGSVRKPGMFSISPFARILDGLIITGGPAENGSLKNIRLVRGNKVIGIFDFYQFVLKGDDSKNITLQHGDKIFVPLIENLAAVRGDVVRPGIYEINKDSNLSAVINTASGVIPGKSNKKIQVMRFNNETKNIIAVKEIITDDFEKIINTKDDIRIEYMDTILITPEYNFTPFGKDMMKTVTVTGEAVNPGSYIIKDGEKLSSLIKRFEGVTEWAYPEGIILTRQVLIEKQKEIINKEIRAREIGIQEEEASLAEALILKEEREIRQAGIDKRKKALQLFAAQSPRGRIIIDFSKISNGEDDIILEKGDSLYIPPVPEWVMISGAVYNPETVIFKEGNNINYYLDIVGGLTERAHVNGIYIVKASGKVLTKLKGDEIISRGDIIIVPEKEEDLENKK
ncbi:MAG: polysaccharide biosynthesis/export family protein [bacterium]